MKVHSFIALAAMVAFIIALAGCSAGTKDSPSAANAAVSALPAYKNQKGEIECPVTGTTISSAESAVGFQDWNGKRYYFCCADCPAKFKADPEKYAVRHEREPM